jgi:F0F1-type ATP synthase gamma subunit
MACWKSWHWSGLVRCEKSSQIASQVRAELTPELNRMNNAATTQEVADIVEGAVDV